MALSQEATSLESEFAQSSKEEILAWE